MSLTDTQIERYSRQILLPGVGGLGQERLLRSTVVLYGSGTTQSVCAAYLAGAGVGALAAILPQSPPGPGPRGRAELPRSANPDCRWLSDISHDPDLVIGVGSPPQRAQWPAVPVLWGRTTAEGFTRVRFASGPLCVDCIDVASPGAPAEDASLDILLAAVLAADALRMLLGLEGHAEADRLRFDAISGDFLTSVPSAFCPVHRESGQPS